MLVLLCTQVVIERELLHTFLERFAGDKGHEREHGIDPLGL